MTRVIEIKLNTPDEILSSLAPSPFHTRDLDDKTAGCMVESG